MSRRFIALPTIPSGKTGGQVWVRCPACGESPSYGDLQGGAMVCPWCDFHFPLEAGLYLDLLVDEDSFRPMATAPDGPCRFGRATLFGRPLVLAVGDPAVTWSEAEARALIALAEEAQRDQHPLLWVTTAPQGAVTEAPWPGVMAALSQLREAGLPWIALLCGSCFGTVGALALQADFVLAEPGATVSALFPEALREAGRLPIESTRSPRQLLRAGWADSVLRRREQRLALTRLLDLLGVGGKALPRAPAAAKEPSGDPLRPLAVLTKLFDPFFELHGDRHGQDDPALVGGLARLRRDGTPVLALVTARGLDWREVRRRHGGAIGVGGWRKASRLLRLAGQFGFPVVSLIGAPQLRTSRREQPAALATALGQTLNTLLTLPVPTVAVHLDVAEGQAGRALSATDRVLARETVAAHLKQRGVSPNGIFTDEKDLNSALVHHLAELTQTYAVHGPLGRRKLLQQRYIRWARSLPAP